MAYCHDTCVMRMYKEAFQQRKKQRTKPAKQANCQCRNKQTNKGGKKERKKERMKNYAHKDNPGGMNQGPDILHHLKRG